MPEASTAGSVSRSGEQRNQSTWMSGWLWMRRWSWRSMGLSSPPGAAMSVGPASDCILAAMPLTASLGGDDPSPSVPSPPPLDGDPNDPSHTLPSFAFVIYQLSLLLSSLGSTAVDTFARQQLLAALSNVLSTSIHLRQLSISSPSTAVQAAPAPPVTSPIAEPPRPIPHHLPPRLHPRARMRRHRRRASLSAC